MNTSIDITIARKIRAACAGQNRSICKGRSYNRAGVTSSTPVVLIPGSDKAPSLEGQPYLKTQFCGGGGFRKTLYTPSTLQIEVGADWPGLKSL